MEGRLGVVTWLAALALPSLILAQVAEVQPYQVLTGFRNITHLQLLADEAQASALMPSRVVCSGGLVSQKVSPNGRYLALS
ncbi:MAG: hypothetical protein ABUL72_04525, partial [Armatimonadota bacterium]